MRNKIRKILSLVLIMIMLTAFVPLGAEGFATKAYAVNAADVINNSELKSDSIPESSQEITYNFWANSMRCTDYSCSQSQTVTVEMSSTDTILGYYWGTNSDYLKNTFYSTDSDSVSQTVTDAGTYYFTAKGTGGVSETEDITFYKTEFITDEGSVSPEYIISRNNYIITVPTPVNDGHKFIEWNTSPDGTGLPVSRVFTPDEKNYTLYAIWKHTVKYDAGDGSVTPADEKVYYGDAVTLPTPTRNGYTCIGWKTNTLSETIYPCGSRYIPTGTETFYAVWEKNDAYIVTYNANGGSVTPSDITVKKGESVTLPTPVRSGYICLGWSENGSAASAGYLCEASYTPESDISLYAVWKYNDTTNPIGTINCTNDVAPSQTVTLTLKDDAGIEGYYWGKDSTYYMMSGESYTYSGDTIVITKTVAEPGLYHFKIKDINGNLSDDYTASFYRTTLNANGGSVSPTSVLTPDGSSFTFPTPTKNGYTYSGWATSAAAASGVTTLKPTANATYYAVWKQNVNIYNLGEETYSFKNFGDSGSPGGHCFGMSITSAGYYLGELDPTVIGISSSSKLNTASFTSKVTEPICYFQHIQGNYTRNAVVAGSITYYNSGKSAEKCWNECVDYVKSHNYDNKGTLQIQIWKTTTSGHAVNFLYYKNVNGQDRLYAYDNNFPNDEVYFYLGSNKKIYESPKSTYGNNVYVETICLVDMNRYLQLSETYSSNYYVFATANTIDIEGATAYPMACGTEEMIMYEIPESASSIKIKPLVNDAEFEYINNEYSFNNIDEDTYGVLAMAAPGDDGTEMSPFSIYNEPQSVDKVTVSDITMNYKDSVTLKPEITAADGSEYTVKYESSNQNVATVDKDGNITTLHKGETKITCTVTDEYGNSVKDTCTVTVKFQWWQWVIWILLFGFLWY